VGCRCGRAAEQAFGAEVFVEVGPVEAVASAGNFPVLALGGCGARFARGADECVRPYNGIALHRVDEVFGPWLDLAGVAVNLVCRHWAGSAFLIASSMLWPE